MRLITLEEHYRSERVNKEIGEAGDYFRTANSAGERMAAGRLANLSELGERRLADMDKAGIDIQVLSHTHPSPEILPAARAIPLCRIVNEELGEAVARYPRRFAAFATLVLTAHPVSELRRSSRSQPPDPNETPRRAYGAHPAWQVISREKTSIGGSPLQQLLPRPHRLIARQVEGADPVGMFELRRMDDGIANVEQLLPSGRNQHGGMSGRVARRGKDQYSRRDFCRPLEQAQAVPGGHQVITNAGRHHGLQRTDAIYRVRLPAGTGFRRLSRTRTPCRIMTTAAFGN